MADRVERLTIEAPSAEKPRSILMNEAVALRMNESGLPKWEMLPPAFRLPKDERQIPEHSPQGPEQKSPSEQEKHGSGQNNHQQKPPLDWCGTGKVVLPNIDFDGDLSAPLAGKHSDEPKKDAESKEIQKHRK